MIYCELSDIKIFLKCLYSKSETFNLLDYMSLITGTTRAAKLHKLNHYVSRRVQQGICTSEDFLLCGMPSP